MLLWLDRDPNRAALAYSRFSAEKKNSTIWCTQVAEALDVLKNYDVTEVHMGHRLSAEEVIGPCSNCTMQLVNWLVKRRSPKLKGIRFTVHTHNRKAGQRMTDRLNAAGYSCRYVPFGTSR